MIFHSSKHIRVPKWNYRLYFFAVPLALEQALSRRKLENFLSHARGQQIALYSLWLFAMVTGQEDNVHKVTAPM
jgi:hypothetical protein